MPNDTAPVRKFEAIRTSQVAVGNAAATKVYSKGTGASGDLSTDDIRVVKNIDTAITIFIGPAGVTSATGFPLLPNESFILTGPSGYGCQAEIWAIGASGNPKVALFTQ